MTDSSTAQPFDADVAIVGAGPVGTMLAILLANRGRKVTLIERWTNHYGLPRAVTSRLLSRTKGCVRASSVPLCAQTQVLTP